MCLRIHSCNFRVRTTPPPLGRGEPRQEGEERELPEETQPRVVGCRREGKPF